MQYTAQRAGESGISQRAMVVTERVFEVTEKAVGVSYEYTKKAIDVTVDGTKKVVDVTGKAVRLSLREQSSSGFSSRQPKPEAPEAPRTGSYAHAAGFLAHPVLSGHSLADFSTTVPSSSLFTAPRAERSRERDGRARACSAPFPTRLSPLCARAPTHTTPPRQPSQNPPLCAADMPPLPHPLPIRSYPRPGSKTSCTPSPRTAAS